MEWIDRLNQAVDHVEQHLTEEIDPGQLSRIAGCSTYHFQRMFTYLAGLPLSAYIRRRRMSLAAAELQCPEVKVLDVALKYGYASPTAFNRAFRSVHGVAPSEIRKPGTTVRSYPPIRFQITVKGVEEMNYRIEKRDAFRILGVSQPIHQNVEENFSEVPQLWQRVSADGTIPRLASLMEGPPMGLLGVSACQGDNWRYFVAVASSAPAGDGLEAYTVPSFTWAVFPGEGAAPMAIQELERRIIAEWFPTSGYEYANGPDMEVYLEPDPSRARFEVWVPVVPKAQNPE